MYREIVIKAYGEEAIKKIDDLRNAGINMTDFLLSAVMLVDIKEELKRQKEKRLACV